MEETLVGRREFSAAAIAALLSGVAISISGCGGGGNSSPTSPSPGTGGNPGGGTSDKTGSISANHGHSAVVSNVQLMGGGAVRLDIRGNADHPHTLDLTAAEVSTIAAGQRVAKDSSDDAGHRHTVTFN
jgi:hypothetical protein